MFTALAEVVIIAIDIFVWLLIISAVLSWLVAFNVVNTRNAFVYRIVDMLYRVTDPPLRPIRRILPNFGGIDLSPIVLILVLWFVQRLIVNVVFRGQLW